MARVTEYRDIPLGELEIGQGQVRTGNPGKGVEDLAASIETQGLLQPIVVCPAQTLGKWEILAGQRRFLAFQLLKRETITAAVLDGHIGEGEAKAISITENLMRRQLSGREIKDGLLYLCEIYGGVEEVVKATGLPQQQVQNSLPKQQEVLDQLERVALANGQPMDWSKKSASFPADWDDFVESYLPATLKALTAPRGARDSEVSQTVTTIDIDWSGSDLRHLIALACRSLTITGQSLARRDKRDGKNTTGTVADHVDLKISERIRLPRTEQEKKIEYLHSRITKMSTSERAKFMEYLKEITPKGKDGN